MGYFVVLEGTDGSGKGTQFRLLARALRKKKIRVKTVDFPQYGKPSAYFAERYLNGDYGNWSGSHERLASLFYAVDRFEAGFMIAKWLREGYVVLANRYVASNMAHQGAKILDEKKRKEFIRWVAQLEYGTLGIPKPHLNILLRVPSHVAYALIDKKSSRGYLRGKRRDIHEANRAHLARAAETYRVIVKMFPREFRVVECAPRSILQSVPDIHREVLQLVLTKLHAHLKRRARRGAKK